MTDFNLKKIKKNLKDANFPAFLKQCRKTLGKYSQKEAAHRCGMSYQTYVKYEQGQSLPANLAYASGMLACVGAPQDLIESRLFPHLGGKLKPAPFEMTDREDAFYQWLDERLEFCVKSKKPLAAFCTLVLFLSNQVGFSRWVTWGGAPEMCKWLEENHGVSYTKQSAANQIERIKESFRGMCDKIESRRQDKRIAELEDEIERLRENDY